MASDFDPYHRWLGVPPEEQPPDHYRLLGVARFESDPEVISNASDQRMTHLRTFASGKNSADSQRMLNEISAATRNLLDASKKTPYDAQLRAQLAAKEAQLAAKVSKPAKPLRVAQAIPLPASAPVSEAVAAATPVIAAAPLVATARPRGTVRRGGKKGVNPIVLIVAGIVLVGIAGGSAIFAYRMSRPSVAVKPSDPENKPKPPPTPDPRPKPTPSPDPTPKPTPSPLAGAERLAWHYEQAPENRGLFYRVSNKQWEEKTSSGQTYSFEEREVKPEHITLYDLSRNLAVKLDSDRISFSQDQQEWQPGQAGKWVPANEVARLREALGAPAAEERTVWFYIDPNGRKGFYRHNGGQAWDEFEEKNLKWSYREIGRTADYVELQNEKNPFKVRLYRDRADSTFGSPDFKPGVQGEWIAPTQLAGRMRGSKPVATADKRTIFYYPDAEGASGYFQKTGPTLWQEFAGGTVKGQWLESGRSDNFIELRLGEERRVRLWSDHVEQTLDGRSYSRLQDGSWFTAAELKAAMKGQRPRTKEVTVYSFNGQGTARVQLPGDALDLNQPFTVEFWFRRRGDLQANAGLLRMGHLSLVLSRQNRDGMDVTACEIRGDQFRRAFFQPTPNGEWHHLAVVGDDGKVSVFHDGQPVLYSNQPQPSVALSDLGVRDLDPIAFGQAQSEAGAETFRGEIKSIRISNSARYASGKKFESPAVDESSLLPGATLALTDVKEIKPGRKTTPPPRTGSLGDLVGLPQEPAKREPVPDAAALKAAEEKINGVFGARVKAAIKVDDKQKLAAELFKTGKTDRDTAQAYAMLLMSRRLAVAAIDVALCIELVNEMSSRVDLDRLKLLQELGGELEKKSLLPPQRELLVDESLAGVHAALREDKVALADSLSVLAASVANKGKDAERKKAARALRDYVVTVKAAADAKTAGEEKLASEPNDPAANLAVGRYLVFVRGDFSKGSEYLAKGSDSALAGAAQKEVAAKSDEEKLAAAVAWSALVGSIKSPADKVKLQRHVLSVCQELLPALSGLQKGQAETQIKELRPLVAEADKADLAFSRGSSKMQPGLIVRVMTGRGGAVTPTPLVAVVRNGQDLNRVYSSNLLREYRRNAIRYSTLGAVVAETDMEVRIRFENCRVVFLNQVRPADSDNPINLRMPLKKGTWPIQIESSYYDLEFEAAGAESFESLFFHSERDLEAELAKTVLDANGMPTKSQQINIQ